MLEEFEAALKNAIGNNSIKYNDKIYGGEWEFIIVLPKGEGIYDVIKKYGCR